MEGSNEAQNVIPELYFLIAKFLSGGPLKETAKTLLKELESVEVLPRRLDWEGNEHPQSYQELDSQYSDMSWRRLASVCERALQLARIPPSLSLTTGEQSVSLSHNIKLNTRLSLLADSLVRPKIKYSAYKQDQSIVRRVISREAGTSPASVPSGRPALSMFPPRLLSALQLQRRTLGHLSAVYCLVFDCTGRYVVTGADDLLVKVWHAADGRLLSTLRGAGAEITDVCVCSTAELVACGSVEKLVRVWCLATGAPRAVLHAHQGTITSVHWAPTGGGGGDVRWLASTSTDGSVAFWACARDGQFLSRPVQYVERMRPGACHMICAAWSAGGAFLAAGSADHHVRVYSLHAPGEHPKRVLEIAVHTEAVDSIAWAHRGLRFVSGSKDGSAALWTLHATQWRHVLLRSTTDPAKRLKVTMVCWDVSDAYVITAVSDHSIRVWDSRTCQQVRVLTGHKDEAYVLEAHPILPGVLLSAGHDGQLFVWNAHTGETLARFHNHIEGQGDGAIFDAKWGASGVSVAASDSHGHLLLLGLGAGHPRLQQLPTELFFHTDYRPLARDALGGALDEQTETPPHLMPPPFLVDVEGAPHAPEYQRLVPGRENLTLSQLIPAAEARSRLDELIEALAGGGEARGVWRGEGVRHTAGSWQRGEPLDATCTTRPIVRPLPQAVKDRIEETSRSQFVWEQAWWRREMRRRPVMISTATDAAPRPAPRRRPAPRPAPRTIPRVDEEPVEESGSDDTSDESVRLSGRSASRSTRSSHSTLDLTDDSSSSSSQYSDWEAGAALAPPARARRRPIPKSRQRYSPSPHTPTKRPERAATSAATETSPVPETSPAAETSPAPVRELPEQYRPGEWITAVSPRKAPYHPQMGDHCLYFRLGHQRYFEAVSEKDIYKVNPRDKPWERTQIHECELVKVVGVKYVIKPPRVVCLKLACALGAPRSFTVRYHDMPDVIDFLVLKQQYAAAVARGWKKGDRFRCMIDDSWWTGSVLSSSAGEEPGGLSGGLPQGGPGSDAARWGAAAARHFLALQVRWDNGEVERLSPWDLEPIDPDRLPAEPGGCVAVLPHELEATLYRAEPHEWPPRGDRASACRAIAQHIGQVMSLSVAEPFVAPVDLQLYPSYAIMIPYPIDLSTIRARFDNLFYRRTAAAQFDVRYLASNAEQFNKPHSPIVRQARLVTDLLLHIISHWREVDVLAKYHELAASYHSSDDEPLATTAANKVSKWREHCTSLLRELMSSADAEPFREPVSLEQAPDYYAAVARPMDLGLVMRQLASGVYSRPEDVAADVRLVFANSRLYNTKPRSRIYTMTVRLSALFEALWSRRPQRPQRPRATDRSSRRPRRRERSRPKRNKPQREVRRDVSSGSSSSEPLSAVKRRDAKDTPAAHSKGKGIGKKSKSSRSSPQPGPSTSAALYDDMEQYANGVPSGSEGSGGDHLDTGPLRLESAGSAYTDVEVLEEELQGDAELEYRPPRPLRRDSGSAHRSQSDVESRSRKRRRRRSSSDSNRRRNRRPKRTRERFASVPSTSSGSASGSGSGPDGGRYESDRSYRPRYSTDDDAPLHLYRQRQEDNSTEAGPSTSRRHHKHSRKSRLRARSPRRYNEESEDDAAAAISKRVGGARSQRPHHHAQRASASNHTDHNYHNGHAAAHNGRVEDPSTGAVSISSRGRVRRLTAKARGLLRE